MKYRLRVQTRQGSTNLKAQKIAFVTGKGGTGKSMVALSMAYNQAVAGKKTLLIELAESSFYQFLTEKVQLDFTPREIKPNLYIARWDGTNCLRDYLLHLVRSEMVLKLIFDNPFMKTLIDVGPSLSELAIVGKITSGVRGVGPQLDFDLIVVDAYATGHMLALIRAPFGIAEAVKMGPMATQCRDMIKTLRDKEVTSYHIVTLPEELAITESLELWNSLNLEIGVTPKIICNKLVMPPLSKSELLQLSQEGLDKGANDFIKFLLDKIEFQGAQLEKVKSETGQTIEIPHFLNAAPIDLVDKMSWYLKL